MLHYLIVLNLDIIFCLVHLRDGDLNFAIPESSRITLANLQDLPPRPDLQESIPPPDLPESLPPPDLQDLRYCQLVPLPQFLLTLQCSP